MTDLDIHQQGTRKSKKVFRSKESNHFTLQWAKGRGKEWRQLVGEVLGSSSDKSSRGDHRNRGPA